MNKNKAKEKKFLLRKEFLEKRNSLLKEEVSKKSDIIIKKLCEYIEKYNLNEIMIFMNMENEIEVTKLINLYPNKNFYIPKTFPNREMKINKYNKNELVLHKFGYYESNSNNYHNENILELIIIPGLVFDINKNRIGFGGGYYDVFLEKIKNNNTITKRYDNYTLPLTIAVCYDFQLINFVTNEKFDFKPQIIITEKQIIK